MINPFVWVLQQFGILYKDVGQILGKFEKLEQELVAHVATMNTKAAKHDAKAQAQIVKSNAAKAQAARATAVGTKINALIS